MKGYTMGASPKYFVGHDIGSEFVHSVVLNSENGIEYAPASRMHFGNPRKAIEDFLFECKGRGVGLEDSSVAFTGSVGKVIAEATGSDYFYETLTLPLGAHFVSPHSRYVFHIGAKDPYFFEKLDVSESEHESASGIYVPDCSTGTQCGGGSGILLTKQCNRLFDGVVDRDLPLQERIEAMYELAERSVYESDKRISVGGRCGVVIQSDMIHLQNKGESLENILRGLFERVAVNYRADVIGRRHIDSKAVAALTGGVFFNDYIAEMFSRDGFVNVERPENFEKVGAIGAALKLREAYEGDVQRVGSSFDASNLANVVTNRRGSISFAESLSDSLHLVNDSEETHLEAYEDLRIFSEVSRKTPVVMGIDGGSTTTKAFVINRETSQPILEVCVDTHGRPFDSAKKIFGQMHRRFDGLFDMQAVAYTGSSGDFYHRVFTQLNGRSPDWVIDEITCHARGVRQFNPDVDTIFEIGGQDAKFTSFARDGTVSGSKMNLSCMAGTGQTMQNMIKMIGLDYVGFQDAALNARRVPVVDDTCGVFVEAGISNLVSLGFSTDEISAAIAYGLISGYKNKFVGNERVGDCISAQGGPFKNLACLSALAAHTGEEINAFPHRQLFGAYGAAILAGERLEEFEDGRV